MSKSTAKTRQGIPGTPKLRVAYGAGMALAGLMADGSERFDWIVDDTPGYEGQKFAGVQIRSSNELAALPYGAAHIVACASTSKTSRAIARHLEALGFQKGVDFIDSSSLAIQHITRKLSAVLVNDPIGATLLERIRPAVEAMNLRNLSGIAGTWLFTALVESLDADGIPGSIAEAGVYQGANAIASLQCSPGLSKRPYFLLDSFEGLGKFSDLDPNSRKGEFADASVTTLREALAPYPNAFVCPGYFEETLPKLGVQDFALAYIDCDLAEPAKICMDYFWNRLVAGGFLLIHDYWFPEGQMPIGAPEPFRGIKTVADGFLADKHARFVVLPETTHLVIRKDGP
jgi:macrocin-O-methyltransferase TylF-like protien